jgi:hypothetical protein
MRTTILLGATLLIVAFATHDAGAMGGGNLAPAASPYALFDQQFMAPSPAEGRSSRIGESYQPAARKGPIIRRTH